MNLKPAAIIVTDTPETIPNDRICHSGTLVSNQ